MVALNASKHIIILLFGTLLTGCVTNKDMYYWGEYESIVRQSYINPGEMDVQTQIEKLSADLQKAESTGKKIAPGVYAQLGVLYAEQGKYTQSRATLIQEKTLFPEASVLIDGMLNRANKAN